MKCTMYKTYKFSLKLIGIICNERYGSKKEDGEPYRP